MAQKRKVDELDAAEKATVKGLVRRFTARRGAAGGEREERLDAIALERNKAQTRWGREADMARKREGEERRRASGACSEPTRANVLHLKDFWEGVVKAAAG